MTTRSEECCVICQARKIRKEANNWCCDCGEGLCLDCHDIHVNSKSSSNHDTISIESYKHLPSSLARIVNYCETHKMKYENYCQYHDKDCCPACIAVDHKSCTDIMLLKDVINAVKTSASFSTAESNVKDLQTNIDHIIADRQQNLDTINVERQRHLNEITLIRTKLDVHLNTLEKKILKELDTAQTKIKRDTRKLITQLLEKTKVANTLAEEIVAIKKYATEYQVYIGSKSVKNKVEKEATYLQSLLEKGKLPQNHLKLIMNQKLSNIELIIRTFGTVETKIGVTSIVLKRRENKQAQIMSNIPNIETTKISYVQQIKLPSSGFWSWIFKSFELQGIIVLPDGKIILADSYYKRLLVVNNDGNMIKSITCPIIGKGPFGVTYIEKNLVAISTSRGILIVNPQTGTIVGSVETNGECRGIAYNNGAFICWVKSIGIQSIQRSNFSTKTLVKTEAISDGLGIAVHRNKIYATHFSNDAVSCYTLEGKQLWQFKNEPILKRPTGIAVDNNSNVFVGAYKRIICLSCDGKKFKTFFVSKEGFHDPSALYFDHINNDLIVANKDQPVYVYHIT